MAPEPQIVISASRRSDIPAFYMDWFFDQLAQGAFEVQNPFNQRIRRVAVSSQRVHTFAFWSKDFGHFLAANCGERLTADGYHLFFNFSLNSEEPLLEPKVPPLSERLYQMTTLCRRFGPESVNWRFDPICFFRVAGGPLRDNLKDFETIAEHAASCGIRRCITSFLDIYGKVQRRAKRLGQIVFEDIGLDQRVALIQKMSAKLSALDMALSVCCEKEVVAEVNDDRVVVAASCIPNDLLMKLFGGKISLKSDRGQRAAAGCGCKLSVDIGSYGWHPCRHDCLFCYANPACDLRSRAHFGSK